MPQLKFLSSFWLVDEDLIYIGVADINLPDLLRQLCHKKIKQDYDLLMTTAVTAMLYEPLLEFFV